MEAKKLVQIRFESNKSDKALFMILHNTRKVKPNYLRNNMAHNQESNTIFINENGELVKYEMTDKKIQTEVNNKLKKQLRKLLQDEKENNKNFREKRYAITQDCIITLSNSINDMYEQGKITKQEINELFVQSVKDIQEATGLELLNISIHYDEKTPHVHASWKNYYNGKSINNTLKKQYSQLQDVAAQAFSKIGFTRGKSKDITNAKHLSVQEMHEQEKKEFIKSQEKEKNEILNNLKKIFSSSNDKVELAQKVGRYIWKNRNKYIYFEQKELKEQIDRLKEQIKNRDELLEQTTQYEENIKNVINKNEEQEKYIKQLENQVDTVINILEKDYKDGDLIRNEIKVMRQIEKVIKECKSDTNLENLGFPTLEHLEHFLSKLDFIEITKKGDYQNTITKNIYEIYQDEKSGKFRLNKIDITTKDFERSHTRTR